MTPSPTPTSTPTLTNTPTATPTPPPSSNPLYLSLANSGPTTVGNLTGVNDEDILGFDGATWAMLFDGSDVGVGGLDLDAFYIVDADTLLMSFDLPATIGSLVAVQPSDIVQFDATSLGPNTAGSFSMYFDGSDVGLDVSAENIDAVELLADGRLLISTTGSPAVPGVSGSDEDLLAFTWSGAPGENTSGTWAMYFDGSDVGLNASQEDVDGVDVAANGDIYLTTEGNFDVTVVLGKNEDVFVCTPTSLGNVTACTFSPALYFDGSTRGLADDNVDGFNLP